jgi:hypothetical protein
LIRIWGRWSGSGIDGEANGRSAKADGKVTGSWDGNGVEI